MIYCTTKRVRYPLSDLSFVYTTDYFAGDELDEGDLLIAAKGRPLIEATMFLLLLEPKCIDVIYCLLLDEFLKQDIRSKIYRLILILLKSNKVSNRKMFDNFLQSILSSITNLAKVISFSYELILLSQLFPV